MSVLLQIWRHLQPAFLFRFPTLLAAQTMLQMLRSWRGSCCALEARLSVLNSAIVNL
jgi:hypothetical protein